MNTPWIFYKRGTIVPYRAYIALMGVFRIRQHPTGAAHPRTFYINEGKKLFWAWDKREMKNLWQKLVLVLLRPRRTQIYFERLDARILMALNFSEKLRKLDLKKISSQQLAGLFDDLEVATTPANFLMNSEVDAVDLYFEDFLRIKLKQELSQKLSPGETETIFRILTKPVSRTYINKQELAVLNLARRKDFSEAAIQHLYDNFWWTNLGWENMRAHSLSYFRRLVKERARLKDLPARLNEAADFISHNRRERLRYLRQLKLSAALKYWLNICDRYIIYHDKRKEVQVKTMYSFHLLLWETARRYKLKADDLEWLWGPEVKNILVNGKRPDYQEIARRRRGVAALVSFNSFKVWSGIKAIELRKKSVKETAGQIKEFTGVGATVGKVTGRVKVCAGAQEALAKIKKNDILVCPMTLPDYVPAMKKAKAIITDEGGITCHAAIISRELRIPCIVGTKIATQVLKDGDKVEIDAEKGTVKLIK